MELVPEQSIDAATPNLPSSQTEAQGEFVLIPADNTQIQPDAATSAVTTPSPSLPSGDVHLHDQAKEAAVVLQPRVWWTNEITAQFLQLGNFF